MSDALETSARRALPLLLLLMLCLAVGCHEVRWISAYDPETDQAVTRLQRGTESLLLELERALARGDGAHEAFEARYVELHVGLRALQVRAAARPDNALQVDQLRLLERNLDLLEEAHRGGLVVEEIEVFRRGFDAAYGAILKLELAKKRGED